MNTRNPKPLNQAFRMAHLGFNSLRQAPGIPAEFQLKGSDLVLDYLTTHGTSVNKCAYTSVSTYIDTHVPAYVCI